MRSLPVLVTRHIREEGAAGRLLGPLPPLLASDCQVSPIGLIPRSHQPGKWCLIVDLSSPRTVYIWNIRPQIGVKKTRETLTHTWFQRQRGDLGLVLSHALHFCTGDIHPHPPAWQGSQLAKIDIHEAYRMVPMHADDHPLLGIQWQNEIFVDTALPFGLRCSPNIWHGFCKPGG